MQYLGMENYYDEFQFKDTLQFEDLRNYTLTFLAQDSFKLNVNNYTIDQKVNSQISRPSVLGTAVLNFVLNADERVNPKIVLADLPLQHQISQSTMNLSLSDIKDNYFQTVLFINLIEKTLLAKQSKSQGCQICQPLENQFIPSDHFSPLIGDHLYKINHKLNHLSRQIFDHAQQNAHEYQHVMVLTEEKHTFEIVKNLFLLFQSQRLESLAKVDLFKNNRNDFVDYYQSLKTHQLEEFTEKTAILETIFQVVDQTSLQQLDLQNDIKLDKYCDHIQYYGSQFNYENLTENQNNSIYEIENGNSCAAYNMIFGFSDLSQYENQDIDFETQQINILPLDNKNILSDKNDEIAVKEMKRIFSIIRSNTTQKRVLSKSEYTNTKPKLKLKKK